ncbi:hypothetical protein Q3G72_027931 [Acer saccharum]|nr:hypothetical protein Q3G72_027931 [Acer saccharum]
MSGDLARYLRAADLPAAADEVATHQPDLLSGLPAGGHDQHRVAVEAAGVAVQRLGDRPAPARVPRPHGRCSRGCHASTRGTVSGGGHRSARAAGRRPTRSRTSTLARRRTRPSGAVRRRSPSRTRPGRAPPTSRPSVEDREGGALRVEAPEPLRGSPRAIVLVQHPIERCAQIERAAGHEQPGDAHAAFLGVAVQHSCDRLQRSHVQLLELSHPSLFFGVHRLPAESVASDGTGCAGVPPLVRRAEVRVVVVVLVVGGISRSRVLHAGSPSSRSRPGRSHLHRRAGRPAST